MTLIPRWGDEAEYPQPIPNRDNSRLPYSFDLPDHANIAAVEGFTNAVI